LTDENFQEGGKNNNNFIFYFLNRLC